MILYYSKRDYLAICEHHLHMLAQEEGVTHTLHMLDPEDYGRVLTYLKGIARFMGEDRFIASCQKSKEAPTPDDAYTEILLNLDLAHFALCALVYEGLSLYRERFSLHVELMERGFLSTG